MPPVKFESVFVLAQSIADMSRIPPEKLNQEVLRGQCELLLNRFDYATDWKYAERRDV